MSERDLREDATRLLLALGDAAASTGDGVDQLVDIVYPELRRIASGYLRRERAEHTLRATEVVHEAYLRLIDSSRAEWKDRSHFLGIAARVMRQVLVDHARTRSAEKRGGDRRRVTLDTRVMGSESPQADVLDLDDALTRLAAVDERAARVTEMRVFAGLTVVETAQALDVSERTVYDDWSMARLWLSRELAG